MTVTYDTLSVEWKGYATVRLETPETVVYLDPGRYGVLTGEWEPDSDEATAAHPASEDYRPHDADIVCLTHVHHYDPEGVRRVAHDETTIVAFEGINTDDTSRDIARLAELPQEVTTVSMEDERVVADVLLWTMPAYNDPEGPRTGADGTPYHPRGFGCGFLLSIDGIRVYWPGDTDVLAGQDELDVDVLLPPIGGAFTMDRQEAADLAESMDPDLVVPTHYNTFDALEIDSRAFARDVAARGVPVALDE